MTFKDSSVIVDNEEEYEGDVLENQELQSSFRQRMKLKKQSQAAGGYTATNYNGNRSILPQYDEEDEEVVSKRNNRIILAASRGGVNGQDEDALDGLQPLTKEQRLEELREKLNGKSKTKVSLEVSKVSSSDYFHSL